jgi:hypothetical protein
LVKLALTLEFQNAIEIENKAFIAPDLENIFNLNETGLFFSVLPNKTYALVKTNLIAKSFNVEM